jgi:hypothetical protein
VVQILEHTPSVTSKHRNALVTNQNVKSKVSDIEVWGLMDGLISLFEARNRRVRHRGVRGEVVCGRPRGLRDRGRRELRRIFIDGDGGHVVCARTVPAKTGSRGHWRKPMQCCKRARSRKL